MNWIAVGIVFLVFALMAVAGWVNMKKLNAREQELLDDEEAALKDWLASNPEKEILDTDSFDYVI